MAISITTYFLLKLRKNIRYFWYFDFPHSGLLLANKFSASVQQIIFLIKLFPKI